MSRDPDHDPVAQADRLRAELIALLRSLPYADYLRTSHWQAVRALAVRRALRTCQLCDAEGSLEIHHRTYVRLGEERPEDLVAVCRPCHEVFEESGHLPIPTVWGRV